MLGGRAAEKVFLGDVSSGADEDIRQATLLARAMVARWGMSDEVGPDVRETDEHPFLGREIAQPQHLFEATAEASDKAVRRLLREAEHQAQRLLKENRRLVETLIAALEADESIDRETIESCLGKKKGVAPRVVA